jgi:hypothetical protein
MNSIGVDRLNDMHYSRRSGASFAPLLASPLKA